MLRLIEKELLPETIAHLQSLQAKVDAEIGFGAKADRAGKLWDNKTGAKEGKAAFADIKEKLTAMCVSHGLCNYCEQNEASDIEHIAPKSLFPELAFVWGNYLLACKHCNTGFKLDAMYVFHPVGSTNAVFAARGMEPPSKEIAYIQPRDEDPMELMELFMLDNNGIPPDFEFYPRPPHFPGTKGHEKVVCTLEILGMGEQRSLQKLREHAFHYFTRCLKDYAGVSKATDFDEILKATGGVPVVNPSLPFHGEKNRILQMIEIEINQCSHPTVWQEMIRQRDFLSSQIQSYFQQAPDLIAAAIRP
jgi:hypothetical protein